MAQKSFFKSPKGIAVIVLSVMLTMVGISLGILYYKGLLSPRDDQDDFDGKAIITKGLKHQILQQEPRP